MSITDGPRIVTSGLIFSLDAANTKSYPGSGTTWTDLSSRYVGTLTNGPTFSTTNNGSIVFDGVDDHIDFGSYPSLGSSNRTIDVWFMINSWSASGFNRIFSLTTDNGINDAPAMTLAFTTSGSTLSIGMGGAPYDGYPTIPTTFSLGQWYNITVTAIANTQLTVYVNGQFSISGSNTGSVTANPYIQLARYNGNYGQYANCRIAKFKIYNRVLTAAEIAQNYNAMRGRFGL